MGLVIPTDYQTFLERKRQYGSDSGFNPTFMPDWLFDFQASLVEWATRKGRAAIFADCGLGKTPMQLVWAENVVRKTNKPVLIVTPLAVSQQTVKEAEKFGIEAAQSRDGKHSGGIVVTNYERLHYFDATDFAGVVCDESSILKSFTGERRKQITRFMSKRQYRLLCTATAAPNDYIELGTSSESLAELSYSEMLRRFFKQLDDKGQKSEKQKQDNAATVIASDPNYYKKLAYRVAQTIGQWRLKHHAVTDFWRWVCSWARACRKPSDLGGFDDTAFILPQLFEHEHLVTPNQPAPGMLFDVPVYGLAQERTERRRTVDERCQFVAELVNHSDPVVVWCHLNQEGDLLEKLIPGAKQIAGKTPDDQKCELYEAFSTGELRVLVIKPKIGAWGLNWQHCNRVVTFPTHSYEQYYQSLRRCWRFGQKRPVTLDVVTTEGECRVIGNLRHKAEKADRMFSVLVEEMRSAERIEMKDEYTNRMTVPRWL